MVVRLLWSGVYSGPQITSAQWMSRQITENNTPPQRYLITRAHLMRFTPFNITMSRRSFPRSLLRYISDVSREIQMLTGPHFPSSPAPEIRPMSTFHLPDVQAPTHYLIGMGIRPALAYRLSNVYMGFVARYRQVFESHFRRAIQGNCDLHLEHYRDIFVIQFKGTIQVLQSQFMSTTWVWLCQAGLPTLLWPQSIDVKILIFTTLLRS